MKIDVAGLKLRDSAIPGAGKGVFATADIASSTFIPVKPHGVTVGVDRKESEIPEKFLSWCIARGNGIYHGPADFEDMELVWYLNHSNEPNAEQRPEGYYSLRPIEAGEEILIDYNTLGEPNEKKEDYYQSSDDKSAMRVAQYYFDLSNKSDFEGIAQLFTDETVYSSPNTGEYVGANDILAMQKAFHGKFEKLHWKVNIVKEEKPGTVLFDYDFEAETKDGEKITSSGLEHVTVKNGRISRVEIRNKP